MSVAHRTLGLWSLPPRTLRTLRRITVDGVLAMPLDEAVTVDYRLMDNADGDVLMGDRLLLWRDGRLECFAGAGAVQCVPAPAMPDFPVSIPQGALKDALAGLSDLRRLTALGDGVVTCQTLRFVDDDGKTHARLSLWSMNGQGRRTALIAELRALRGYEGTARSIAAELATLGARPFRAQAVIGTLFPVSVQLKPDAPVLFGADAPALDVVRRLIEAQLAILRRSESGIIDDIDTEFLHAYRVALRRMRSVASLFAGVIAEPRATELKARLSALMRATGPLRDLDVRMLDAPRLRVMVPSALQPGLDAMEAISAARRAEAQGELANHLRKPAYTRDMHALARLLSASGALRPGPAGTQAIGILAARLIDKRRRKFRRLALAIDPETPDAAVHELRIEGKRLRYLLEFVTPLYGKDALAGIIRPLKQLQDSLGRFNDACVQAGDLAAFTQRIDPVRMKGAVEMAAAAGALQAALELRRVGEREALTAALAAFDHKEAARQLRRLVPEGQPIP